jgi:chromosome segregation ATPase
LIEEASGTAYYHAEKIKAQHQVDKSQTKLEKAECLLKDNFQPYFDHLKVEKQLFTRYKVLEANLCRKQRL